MRIWIAADLGEVINPDGAANQLEGAYDVDGKGLSIQDLLPKGGMSGPTEGPTPDNMKVVYHIVQPGDTLWNIASRYEGVTVERIKEMNALRDNEIKVGTKLKVVIGG